MGSPTLFFITLLMRATLFFFSMGMLTSPLGGVNGECPCYAPDRQALMDFKSQIREDFSNRLLAWSHNCCCTWPGVLCDSHNKGRVVSLNLSLASTGDESDYGVHSKMYGTLSPSLGQLSMLETLDLSHLQYLSREVPQALSKLTNLRSLLLNANNFSGPIPSLSSLHKLKVLNLHSNDFQGTIPSWFGNLSNLRVLDFSYNGKLKGPIPTSITNLSKLEQLNLGGLFVTSSTTLPHDFSNLHSLTLLDISNSMNITGPIPSLLPISLRKIRISNTRINGRIPSSLGLRLAHLEELELTYNKLQGRIPSSLGRVSKLKMLDLSGNKRLKGPIPESFGALSRLRTLAIVACSIDGPLPRSIGGMSSLVDLSLRFNRINGTIPNSIGRLSNLINMVMDHNKLSGRIPNGFTRNLQRLQSLGFEYNKLTGFPSYLSRLTSLSQVYLDNNKGLDPNALSGLATLSSLSMITIRSCGMSGPLPAWLTKMRSQLASVDLSNNLFSGPIPLSLDKLALHSLSLAGNRLSGSIPPTLGNLTTLGVLDLSRNKLSGRIPWELTKLTKLYIFNVSSNHLRGKIPQVAPFISFDKSSYSGNSGLCGHPLPPCPNGKQ